MGAVRTFTTSDKCYGDDMTNFKCDFDCTCNIIECECEPDECEGEDCEFRYDYNVRCDCKCAEHPKSVSYDIELLYCGEYHKKYRYVVAELEIKSGIPTKHDIFGILE
jgi:hypothetical protein